MKNENYTEVGSGSDSNPDAVPGIFNYCDRWCMLCSSKTKCALYVKDQWIREESEEDSDMEIMCILDVTMDFLQDSWEGTGIGWVNERDEEIFGGPEPVYDDLNVRARMYAETALYWVHTYMDDVPPLDKAKFSMYVVGYYTWIIMSRIERASLPVDAISKGEFDRNAFAKVALLSMDKSLKGLMALVEYMPDHQDEILQFLKDLSSLIKEAEYHFRDARNFIRPGLDE